MDRLRNHKFYQSLFLALAGIWQAVKTERNIKIELGFALLAVLAGFYFGITKGEWLAIILIIFAVLSAEIFNSAIEAICNCERDKLHLDYDETRLARDIAAGAVLFLAIGSVILGLIIFLPYLLKFF